MHVRRAATGAALATVATLAFVCLAAGPSAAAAAVVRADGARVRAVTVYLDRAEVVRVARVDVSAGTSAVELPGLPLGVDATSVRVSARGVPATLGAVQLVEAADQPEEPPELAAARGRLRDLEAERGALVAAGNVDGKLSAFLDALRATRAETAAQELGAGGTDAAGLAEVYDLLSARYTGLFERQLRRNRELEDLKERLAVAQARLQTLKPAGAIRSRTARVDVTAERAGALDLELTYLAPGASWQPSYRAELDADTGNVTLTMEGIVRQTTGEDWAGVELKLSSASPRTGVAPPALGSRFVHPIQNAAGGFAKFSDEFIRSSPVPGRFYQNALALTPGITDGDPVPAEAIQAALERTAYNVAFRVPGRSDVPADGRDHRVRLQETSLDGTLVYRVVPELDPRAYLTAKTTTPAEHPILAGRVRVVAGGAHLGSYAQAELGPGVEWVVPFGVDNRLAVERVREPRSAGRQGFRNNKRTIAYVHRTRLHNLRDRPVELVLEERLPVAEDERIEVEIDDGATTAGAAADPLRPGVQVWTFELAAGEEREIVLSYDVTWPSDLSVTGLPEGS